MEQIIKKRHQKELSYLRSKEALLDECLTEGEPNVNQYLFLEVLVDIRDELSNICGALKGER